MTRRLVRALDLVNNPELIESYEKLHAPSAVWPTVVAHIRAQGVLDMEIWRVNDRLVMILEVCDDYPRATTTPPRVEEWEALMEKFQRRLPGSGEKWKSMKQIFSLAEQRADCDD